MKVRVVVLQARTDLHILPHQRCPPVLSSLWCLLGPLCGQSWASWTNPAPPQPFQFAELFTFSCWVSPSTLGRVRICVWSLFSVSTQRLWSPVKVCVKDWAVNWKLWVRAGRSCPLRRPSSSTTKMLGRQPASEKTSTPGCSVIKNNGIVCRMRGGNPKILNCFYFFVFSLSCRFHYSSVRNILKQTLFCFETENLQQPLRWKTSLWFEMLCWKRHVLFHFQNEHAAL